MVHLRPDTLQELKYARELEMPANTCTSRAASRLVIPMLRIDRSQPIGLRDQIRSEISRLIAQGALVHGAKLPSCRALAKGLGVAVNSVLGAYSRLMDEGVIVSKPKSGYFVSLHLPTSAVLPSDIGSCTTTNIAERITRRKLPSKCGFIWRPPDWQNYKYPFVCNQIPLNRFPLAEWRQCTQLAMNSRDLGLWAGDSQYWDSTEFLDQICSRILPRRGVIANPDNVLITVGAQQAIYLIATLLRDYGRVVAMEDPGYPDARNIFEQVFDETRPIAVDEEGIVVDSRLADCDLVYVTPNRQFPTTASMSAKRRKMLMKMAESSDFLIIEDDYEGDMDFRPSVLPPLFSGNSDGRVIYTGSLSKSLAPGLRLGYLVAQEGLVREARALRGMMIRHPPLILQRTAALFLRFGHHDVLRARLHTTFERRWSIASRIISEVFSDFDVRNEFGSTSFLFADRQQRNAQQIAARAMAAGVVIEPVGPCFATATRGDHMFRVGVSAVRSSLIEPGLTQLRHAIDAS